MQGEIKHFSAAETLCRAVAEDFINLARQCITLHGEFNIALSGGNTPEQLYKLLADEYGDAVSWDKLRFYFGDERHVPVTHVDSNFNMVDNALLKHLRISENAIYPIQTKHEPDIAASLYAQTLIDNLPDHNGLPKFDLVFLGMGMDGHTASLFSLDSLQDKKIVIATYVEKFKSWRISLNYNVLNNADSIWVLITGADKHTMFSQLQSGNANDMPISAITPQGRLSWYVDHDVCP